MAAKTPLTAVIQRFLPNLRYPWLFLILASLLVVDLVTPDPIPMLDEALLAVLTFIAASFRTRTEDRPPPRDITPEEEEEDPKELSSGDPQQ